MKAAIESDDWVLTLSDKGDVALDERAAEELQQMLKQALSGIGYMQGSIDRAFGEKVATKEKQ